MSLPDGILGVVNVDFFHRKLNMPKCKMLYLEGKADRESCNRALKDKLTKIIQKSQANA
jgi:hypothetical protein